MRTHEKDPLRPRGEQIVRQKCTLQRQRILVICGQTRKDGLVSESERLLDYQEESMEHVCNPQV